MTRSSIHQSTNSVWLVAALLVAAATVAVGLTRCDRSGLPPDLPKTATKTGMHEPEVALDDIKVELHRDAPLTLEDANRGEPGSRQLSVHVDQYQRANGLPLRIELLFGDRGGLRTVNLFADGEGNASWPSGSEAPWPRFVDFAFPTVSATGRDLAPNVTDVQLAMPEVCVLEIEVVEVGGRVTSDALTAHVRSPSAAWPQNRWRPLRLKEGRKQLLAEAAGERIELRVLTASGRFAQAVFFAADTPGERVPCSVPLAASNGVELALHGLPGGLADADWLVDVHDLVHAPIAAHRWPGAQHRYVMFPRHEVRQATQSYLVLAVNESRDREMYWGRTEGSEDVVMHACQPIAIGRVVDQGGEGAPGFHVDLVARGSRIVLNSVISARDGGFQLPGPDPGQVAVEIVLREARDEMPAAVPLPAEGKLVLRVPR